ncbi:ribosomal protein [Salix suchowensis]|nr:ribosomal protein [Salix suchowensis]
MGRPVDSIRRRLLVNDERSKLCRVRLSTVVSCIVARDSAQATSPWDRISHPPSRQRKGLSRVDLNAPETSKLPNMAEVTDPQVAADLKKKRTFRTFSYRGVELDKLLDMNNEDLVHARARRRFQRGLKRRPMVKTHLRDMIIVPEMIGSVVGIYNGKVFNSVEIKPEMTGHYLAEFSCSYKPVKHGRPGVRRILLLSVDSDLMSRLDGATHCKRFPVFMLNQAQRSLNPPKQLLVCE